MKKILSATLFFAALCCIPAWAAPKKAPAAAETSPAAWAKKLKSFDQKQVYTYVDEIGASGYTSDEAAFAVIPVKTATEKGQSNGRILVLVSPSAFKKPYIGFSSPYQLRKFSSLSVSFTAQREKFGSLMKRG